MFKTIHIALLKIYFILNHMYTCVYVHMSIQKQEEGIPQMVDPSELEF